MYSDGRRDPENILEVMENYGRFSNSLLITELKVGKRGSKETEEL